MFRRIVGPAIELDTFFNRIPVRQYASRNRPRRAPAVERMLPLLLHRQERLAVSGRNRVVYARKRLPQFFAGVRYEGLQWPRVFHRDYPAFDRAPQQFASQLAPVLVVQATRNIPALRL